eukprot:167072-Pelagomonas_calceolata.AAC.4
MGECLTRELSPWILIGKPREHPAQQLLVTATAMSGVLVRKNNGADFTLFSRPTTHTVHGQLLRPQSGTLPSLHEANKSGSLSLIAHKRFETQSSF